MSISTCSKKASSRIVDDTYDIYQNIIDTLILSADKNNLIATTYNQYKIDLIVLRQVTFPVVYNDSLFNFNKDSTEVLAELKRNIKSLEDETFNNLLKVNKRSDSILYNFKPIKNNFKIVFISDSLIKDLFLNDENNGWNKFYKLYPNSKGIYSFSKIGFNKSKSQALLEFHSHGAGYYVFYRKVDNKWIYADGYQIYIE